MRARRRAQLAPEGLAVPVRALPFEARERRKAALRGEPISQQVLEQRREAFSKWLRANGISSHDGPVIHAAIRAGRALTRFERM